MKLERASTRTAAVKHKLRQEQAEANRVRRRLQMQWMTMLVHARCLTHLDEQIDVEYEKRRQHKLELWAVFTLTAAWRKYFRRRRKVAVAVAMETIQVGFRIPVMRWRIARHIG
jgi:hypothetical protein